MQINLTRELVSKETHMLRWWGRETQNLGFINSVDKSKFLCFTQINLIGLLD